MGASYLKSPTGSITCLVANKLYNVQVDHANYEKILALLTTAGADQSKLPDLLNTANAIKKHVIKSGVVGVTVENGNVLYNGEVLHNTVCDRIIEFTQKSYDFNPLVKFLDNLMGNPSKASLDNLYRFLEHNKCVITEDGCFLAYKRVKKDYKDIYTGTLDNSPGQVLKMERNRVQDDPSVLCSFGLHVASIEYAAKHYNANDSTDRLVVVKVNPSNVVSIPTDYNNAKMRVCEYEVIGDYEHEFAQEEFSCPVEDEEIESDEEDDYEEDADDFNFWDDDEIDEDDSDLESDSWNDAEDEDDDSELDEEDEKY